MNKIFIGTSGFSYPHWKGIFYPKNLPPKDWFLYYRKHFDTVELNVSFYRLPKKETFSKWRKIAGPPAGGFVFSVKGWRWITHIRKLKNCQEEVRKFFDAAGELNRESRIMNHDSEFKIHNSNVVLWQLPPNLGVDLERLANFLEILPKNPPAGRQGWRHAFEFRHPTWADKEIFSLLQKSNAAVVFQDYPDWPIIREITADFVYLRFHGRTGLYSSCYTKKELKNWAEKIKNWQKQGLDVYAYFNNDALGYAIQNAQKLKELCLRKN